MKRKNSMWMLKVFNYLRLDTILSLLYILGKVILQPKNIITGPQFKPLYKTLPHMADEYERTRTLNKVNTYILIKIKIEIIGGTIETYRKIKRSCSF